ncbi:hypothetical protein [Salinibacter phage 7_10]
MKQPLHKCVLTNTLLGRPEPPLQSLIVVYALPSLRSGLQRARSGCVVAAGHFCLSLTCRTIEPLNSRLTILRAISSGA